MLLASFAGRGLIALPLALAVILGADVGSAIVAQVFSLDVKWLWTVLVAIGVLVFMSTEADRRAASRASSSARLDAARRSCISRRGGAAAGLRPVPLAAHRPCGRAVLGFVAAIAVSWLVHSSLRSCCW
jgi:phosphate:Na+ symporter